MAILFTARLPILAPGHSAPIIAALSAASVLTDRLTMEALMSLNRVRFFYACGVITIAVLLVLAGSPILAGSPVLHGAAALVLLVAAPLFRIIRQRSELIGARTALTHLKRKVSGPEDGEVDQGRPTTAP